MENKYTRFIDNMFDKYDKKGTSKYIYLGFCHKGDEDGGCDDYDHIGECWYDVEQQEPSSYSEQCLWWRIDPDNEKLNDDYEKDWDELCRLLNDGFRDLVKANYQSTNGVWWRHYFIGRDYHIYTVVSRGDLTNEKADQGSVDQLNEKDAELAEDRQVLGDIFKHVRTIEHLLESLKHQPCIDAALDRLSKKKKKKKD